MRPMNRASPHAVQPHSGHSPSGTSGQLAGSAARLVLVLFTSSRFAKANSFQAVQLQKGDTRVSQDLDLSIHHLLKLD